MYIMKASTGEDALPKYFLVRVCSILLRQTAGRTFARHALYITNLITPCLTKGVRARTFGMQNCADSDKIYLHRTAPYRRV